LPLKFSHILEDSFEKALRWLLVMVEAPLPAVSLSVPLQVAAHAADNWDAAH
jgi:hypothetical protein